MFFLFHGDDAFQSRQKLSHALEKYQEVFFLSAREITPEALVKFSSGLFALEKRALVLEHFFSLHPARVKKIIPQLNRLGLDIFFWEERKIDPKRFSALGDKQKAIFSRLPGTIFKFLDSLGSKNPGFPLSFYKQSLKTHPPELILYLIEKRFRELLVAKLDPKQLALPSWQKNRLLSQVKNLDLEEIRKMYLKLIETEWKNKTGRLGNSLENEIVNLVVSIK